MRRVPKLALVLAALVFAPAALWAQEPQLIDVKSGGVMGVLDENLLRLEGLAGTISIRVAREGELRFQCRTLDSRREEREVALWLDDKTFIFRPTEPGDEPERLLIEIGVPPQLDVALELHDSILKLQGLRSDFSLNGTNMQLDARGMFGDVELQLDDSSIMFDGSHGGVELEGERLDVTLKRIEGYLTLGLDSSTAQLEELDGTIELDLTATELRANGVAGQVRVSASEGTLELVGLAQGVELELSDTPLILAQTSGEILIETDSDVTFRDLKGPLRLDGYGGVVRGTGSAELVEIDTNNAEVSLEGIVGATTIKGNQLKISTKAQLGELTIEATSSDVTVDGAQGLVNISTDFGDVAVLKATKDVTIVSADGNVRVTGLKAAVQLTANGPEVVVAWGGMWRENDVRIENQGGTVELMLPPRVGGRVEAQSRYGRVESNVEGIDVAEDGSSASGTMRRVAKPKLSVFADGDVVINRKIPQATP